MKRTLALVADRPPGALVAIASGKGGVGKTWLSITLAQALARAKAHVLLFDGDLGLANVDVQLGLVPERDIGDVVAGRTSLDDAARPFEAGGFAIAAGRSGTGSLGQLGPDKLSVLVDAIQDSAHRYDWVLMDLGAGLERPVRGFAAAASTCIIVTTDEPTALTDAYAFIKVLTRERPGTDIRIVVNLAATREDGERTYGALKKACESFLRFSPPLLGVVRRDGRVPDSIRAQTPILVRHPNADAATDVEAIAQKLAEGS
jgi:flagellar biosynthesis protein FlhG